MEEKSKKSNGMGIFLVSIGILIGITALFYLVFNIDALSKIFAPIVTGVVIAFLMNPILKFYENRIFAWKKTSLLRKNMCFVCSIILTIITIVAIIALVCLLIVPQFLDSIANLISNYDIYLKNFVDFVNDTVNNFKNFFYRDSAREYTEVLQYSDIEKYIQKIIPSDGNGSIDLDSTYGLISSLAPYLKQIGLSVYDFLKNLLIGFFMAFYLLVSKDLRKAQIKKFRRAFLSKKQDEFLVDVSKIANKNFNGFIEGKIIDSLIIGLLAYVVFEVFGISDYNVLNATIVGITNIIPVFGPIIGAIPVAFIVLISNPSKFILVIVLIFIIQQIDGNIIGPKILGDATNVSSLTVIISISVMGSILGIFGMIIGVPLFATIIAVVKNVMEKKLEEKGEPTDTEAYVSARSLSDPNKITHKEEHTWLYKYEHSDVKVRVDSLLAWFKDRSTKRKDKKSQRNERKSNSKNKKK